MKSARRVCWALSAAAAWLLLAVGSGARVAGTAPQPHQKTECLGYHTITVPGEFEYALEDRFSQGLGAWGSETRLHLLRLEPQELSMSQPTGMPKLLADMDAMNTERQREINEIEGRRSRLDPSEVEALKVLTRKLSELHLYEPIPSRDAISRMEKGKLELQALVNGHIFYTSMPPQGTPEQTLDAFLSHYKPRALGEVPDGPGVCVPYGFFTREKQPATIGLNIRLKDQPDIVVYLRASDAATNAPDDPRKLLDGLTPVATFFGSRSVVPTSRFKPLQAITIDGQEGLGSFVVVTRRTVADQSRAFNNAADGNQDWGYFAYVPGRSGGKPGESFNITFKVERFGRFAQRPMTEREFRDLTLRIAASIKRRPGAWVAN